MILSPKRWRIFSAIFITLILVINHQGCGNSAFEAAENRAVLETENGSDDGMIYLTAYFVQYADCGSSDPRASVIRLRAGEYTLLRENCEDLDRPLPLRGDEVRFDRSTYNTTLTFNGRAYLKESYD